MQKNELTKQYDLEDNPFEEFVTYDLKENPFSNLQSEEKTPEQVPDVRPQMKPQDDNGLIGSISDWFTSLNGSNKARASNELAARELAEERGIDTDEAYKLAGGARPTLDPVGLGNVQSTASGFNKASNYINQEAMATDAFRNESGAIENSLGNRVTDGLSHGFENMVGSLEIGRFALAGGDPEEMADFISDKLDSNSYYSRQRTADEAGIYGGIAAISEAEGLFEQLGSGVRTAASFFGNPDDAAVITAEQAPNMIPTIGLGVAGGAAGGAVANVPGAIVGARSGMALGTTAVEFGAELEQVIIEKLGEDIHSENRKAKLKEILQDPEFMTEARIQAVKKGVTVAAVDQAFLGISGKIASAPSRKAIKEGVKASLSEKIKAGAAGVAVDMVGEGAGEALSQKVARGEVDAGDAWLEALASGPTSMIETGAGLLMEQAKALKENRSAVESLEENIPTLSTEQQINQTEQAEPVLNTQESAEFDLEKELEQNPFDEFIEEKAEDVAQDIEGSSEAVSDGTLSDTGIYRVPVKDIKIDAKSYQFRTNVNEAGVDNRLDEVKEWDDERAGVVTLHRRNSGELYVSDGHHRVHLAKRLGAEQLNARIKNESEGVTVEKAMVEAALNNIANDNADAIDIAKVLRFEGGTLESNDLPRTIKGRRGESISKLNDHVYGMATNGQLPEEDAAVIGTSFEQEQQDAAANAFVKVGPETEYQRQLLVGEIKAAEFAKVQGDQGGLFGDDPQEVSLMQDRLKVLDSLRQKLNADKRLFASLNKNADRASEAGNKIAKDTNSKISENSAKSLELIARVATTPALNEMVNRAARRVFDGESVSDVTKDLKQEILSYERNQNDDRGRSGKTILEERARRKSGRQDNEVGNEQRASEQIPEGNAENPTDKGQHGIQQPVRRELEAKGQVEDNLSPDPIEKFVPEDLKGWYSSLSEPEKDYAIPQKRFFPRVDMWKAAEKKWELASRFGLNDPKYSNKDVNEGKLHHRFPKDMVETISFDEPNWNGLPTQIEIVSAPNGKWTYSASLAVKNNGMTLEGNNTADIYAREIFDTRQEALERAEEVLRQGLEKHIGAPGTAQAHKKQMTKWLAQLPEKTGIQPDDLFTLEQGLSERISADIEDITDNRELKKVVADSEGIKASEVSNEMMKRGQEAVELALVKKAREVVKVNKGNDKQTYDALLELYKNQPNLNVRSSTSMENQAYSTPAPLSYLASRMAHISESTAVYEPTAGNGMLLLASDPDKASVNELDPKRAKNLRELGFDVTENDATSYTPKGLHDSAIMNPPFGKLRDDQGKIAPVKYDDYTIKSIDHLIAAKALEAISDDGKATIIIGADKKAGNIGSSDRVFFNWLYSHFNVTDHFEIDGKLYNRQGAGWPIRVISLDGRIESETLAPKSGSIERFNNWEDIYEHFEQGLDSRGRFVGSGAKGVSRSGEQGATDDAPLISQLLDGEIRSSNSGSRKAGESDRVASDSAGLANRSTNESRQESSRSAGMDGQSRPNNEQGSSDTKADAVKKPVEPEGTNTSKLGERPKRKSVKSSEFQTSYNSRSEGSNEAVLTPNNMAEPLQQALSEIENSVGNLDTYLVNKLGYSSKEDLHNAFMGLQIDAVAAAIYNFENKEKGVIIADQTGVGKGRQAAAIIRYAVREGKIPVFVTVTENLFTDMYEDLSDIGSDNIQPFILNADSGITTGGKRLYTNKKTGHKKLIAQLAKDKVLPEDRNALFLTYSQINTPNEQRQLIRALRDDAIFVLDESHNAAGEQVMLKKKQGVTIKQQTGAGFINEVIKDKPVVYLSATFAKRPDNMPVYYRTDLLDAVDSSGQLVDAVAAGGVPLQSAMSGMLARSGQLIRRERSFEGISIPVVFDKKNKKSHEKISDQVTSGLRAVVTADTMFHEVFLEEYKEQAQESGYDVSGAGNKASKTIDHTNFNAVVHNYVRQLLLSLKAEEAASQAISAHKKGVKPVIALENTMGAFIAEYVDDLGLNYGDTVEADYRDVLQKALDRTRRLTVKDDKGNAKTVDIPLSVLDPATRTAYESAAKVIAGLDVGDFPISPIDLMRKRLNDAGIAVAELTGRSQMLDYAGGKPVLTKRPAEESNKRATVNRFNNGSLDALIINRSGSTGLSIHASERFKDQKPRHMIVAQTMQDINILVQMLGRINRTGQVELPTYTLMGLDLPAEKRPLAKSARNMKSLNANTSANEDSDSSLDVPDMYNKYGDQVVAGFLAENKDVGKLVGMSAASEDGAYPDMALKFTGRLALLPVKKQEEIYKQIEPAYEEKIEYLTKTGQNDLIASTLDTDAKIMSSKVVYEGKKPGTIFGGHTTLHKVSIKLQGKPPLSEDVEKAVSSELAGIDPLEYTNAIVNSKRADELKVKGQISDRIERAIKDRDSYIQKPKHKPERLQKLNGIIESQKVLHEKYVTHVAGMETRLKRFKVGTKHRLDLGDDVVLGVVTEVRDTHNGKGDPWAASKVKVRFMVNSGIRAIDIPLSTLGLDKGIYQETLLDKDMSYEQMFDNQIDSNAREIRYIATGNLIAGSAKLSGGRIVNFTDDKGKTHQGIMMPKKYGQDGEFDSASEKTDFAVRDHKIAVKFLKANQTKLEFAGGIFSSSKAVRLTKDSKGWLVSVPRGNKEHDGRVVKFDDELRKITGDFFGSGKTMVARFDEKHLSKVTKRLMELTPLYALPSMRTAWEAAGGAKSAEAIKSFDEAPKFSISSDNDAVTVNEKSAISEKEANGVIDAITFNWGKGREGVELVGTFDKLPAIIKSFAEQNGIKPGQVKGVYHREKLYLVRDAHQNAEGLERTIFHEAYGHYGVYKLFGQNVSKVLNQIYVQMGGKTKLLAYAKKHGIKLDKYIEFSSDLEDNARHALLMSELIAHMSEDQKPSIVRKIRELIGLIRNWLREKGFFKLANYSESDLFLLLKRAREAVHNIGRTGFVTEEVNENRDQSRMERAIKMGYITDIESVIERRIDNGRNRSRSAQVRSEKRRSEGAGSVSEENGNVENRRGTGTSAKPPRPQVFFHGTRDTIESFDLNHPHKKDHGWLGRGVYVTNDERFARAYSKLKKGSGSAQVMPLFIKAKKLYEMSLEEKDQLSKQSKEQVAKFTDKLIAAGYDGSVLEFADGTQEIAIFHTNNIRSVDAQFNPARGDSSNIYFSLDDDDSTNGKRDNVKKLYKGLPKQPIDKLFRVPFDALNTLDSHGRFKPGTKLSAKSEDVIKNWQPHAEGKFSWMTPLIESARHGLIDRYKLSDEYKSTFREAEALGRNIDMQALDILRKLEERGVDAAEAAVLQRMLTGEKIKTHHLNAVAAPILKAIDDLGLAAVEYGVITRKQFERNRGAYLHRSYVKHEGEFTGLGKWILDKQTKHHKRKIQGKASKGRGIEIKLPMDRLLRHIPNDWFGVKNVDGKPDLNKLSGQEFYVLDNPGVVPDYSETFEGMETGAHKKIIETVYWPKGTPIPNKYRDYRNRGTYEVRGNSKKNVVLWRDYTKAERENMGEILDARYNIAKTFQVISRDIAMGKFFQDVSKNDQWFLKELPPGETALTSQQAKRLSNLSKLDWVHVPDTTVAGSAGTKQWGALAGGYVRSEIWRDLTELDKMHHQDVWQKVLTQWKLNKTARSPVVHMNNVMSNIMFMDLADVRMSDLVSGIKSYYSNDEHRRSAEEHGAFEGSFASEELRKQVMEPILEELAQQNAKASVKPEENAVTMWKLIGSAWAAFKKADNAMVGFYQVEDELFRMATYMRRINLGDSPKEAARMAREQFLDYDIRAPWINAARRTVLPFISYTYRAVPVLARAIAERPWKVAKYVTLAHLATAFAYMLDYGDEDEERRTMREDQQGYTWLGVPRMARMPWHDEFGNPVFLDIRRWIPAGDIFDMNQGSSALPIPSWLQFGGPLMLGAEFITNKQAFTGKEITNETDTGVEAFSKTTDWLYKSWMPSAAYVPGSYYWDKLGTAWKGGRDILGRPYSFTQAMLSSIGIKVQPHDIKLGYTFRSRDLAFQARQIKGDIKQAQSDLDRNLIPKAEYNRVIADARKKLLRLKQKNMELNGYGGE